MAAKETMDVELQNGDKGTGAFVTLQCDTYPLTTDTGSLAQSQDENLVCGLLTIFVTLAWNIPLPRERAKSYVKASFVSEGGTKDFYTGTITDYRYFGAQSDLRLCLSGTANDQNDGRWR